MKILVTAFQPFGGENMNSALETMKLLPDYIGNIQIIKKEIPTVFRKSMQEVWMAMEQEQPDVVISLGQAGGRNCISVERIAINMDDARIPDNEGNQPVDKPIFEDGENAYFSTLPIKGMVNAIKIAGIRAEVSNSAGTYVCNHLLYGVLYKIHKEKVNIKAGFIHVPYITEQVADKPNMPSMALKDIVTGIKSCLLLISDEMTK